MMRKRPPVAALRRITMVLALTTPMLAFGSAQSALALPTDCDTGRWTLEGGWASCTGGGQGQFRVRLVCLPPNPFADAYVRVGPWRSSGLSNAYCNTWHYARDIGIELIGPIG